MQSSRNTEKIYKPCNKIHRPTIT